MWIFLWSPDTVQSRKYTTLWCWVGSWSKTLGKSCVCVWDFPLTHTRYFAFQWKSLSRWCFPSIFPRLTVCVFGGKINKFPIGFSLLTFPPNSVVFLGAWWVENWFKESCEWRRMSVLGHFSIPLALGDALLKGFGMCRIPPTPPCMLGGVFMVCLNNWEREDFQRHGNNTNKTSGLLRFQCLPGSVAF